MINRFIKFYRKDPVGFYMLTIGAAFLITGAVLLFAVS